MKKRILSIFIIFCTLLSFTAPSGQAQEDTRSKVVAIAKEYIGVPYKYGGTTPDGFDCSGFVKYVFNKVGVTLPRVSADQAEAGEAVKEANLQPGDIVYFKQSSKARVSHTGIYIGDNKIISSTSSEGIRIDPLNDSSYWGKRYAGARSVINDENEAK